MPRLLYCCLLLLISCQLAQAATPLPLHPLPTAEQLRQQAVFYVGEVPAATLAQAMSPGARFRPLIERRPDLSPGGRWLRLALHNNSSQPGRWLLNLGVPDIQRLEAYQISRGQTAQLVSLRPDSRFTERSVPSRMLAVPISLAAGEAATLYLHYRIHGDTPLQLALQEPAEFAQALGLGNLFNGVLVGVLLALLGFALLQYRALRREAYRYYALMLLFVVLFLLQIEGYNFALLWPGAGQWNQYAPAVLVVAVHLTHILFTTSLFKLNLSFPTLYRGYQAYAVLLLLGLGAFLGADLAWPLLLVSLLFMPLPVWVGVLVWRRQLPAAGHFLAGAISLAVFMNVLFSLGVSGVWGWPGVNVFVYPKLGYQLEAVLFALALGQQLHSLSQRHEAALRHRLEEAEQLARAEADKHQALQAAQQQQLQLAAAGHDLSQPLSSIRFALAALRAQAGNEAATQHIDKALDYTESLLQSLMAEAKAGFASRQQGLNLEDLLVQAHTRHQHAAERKGLYLRYFPSSATIAGSGLVLTRILDNLVGNAVRYTERGEILLGVRRRPLGLEIQVLDTGPGFDTSLQKQLLAPFEQTGTLAAERQGHGLGLHIVQALCEQSGYQLTIRSVRGRGSVFGVLVPY